MSNVNFDREMEVKKQMQHEVKMKILQTELRLLTMKFKKAKSVI